MKSSFKENGKAIYSLIHVLNQVIIKGDDPGQIYPATPPKGHKNSWLVWNNTNYKLYAWKQLKVRPDRGQLFCFFIKIFSLCNIPYLWNINKWVEGKFHSLKCSQVKISHRQQVWTEAARIVDICLLIGWVLW